MQFTIITECRLQIHLHRRAYHARSRAPNIGRPARKAKRGRRSQRTSGGQEQRKPNESHDTSTVNLMHLSCTRLMWYGHSGIRARHEGERIHRWLWNDHFSRIGENIDGGNKKYVLKRFWLGIFNTNPFLTRRNSRNTLSNNWLYRCDHFIHLDKIVGWPEWRRSAIFCKNIFRYFFGEIFSSCFSHVLNSLIFPLKCFAKLYYVETIQQNRAYIFPWGNEHDFQRRIIPISTVGPFLKPYLCFCVPTALLTFSTCRCVLAILINNYRRASKKSKAHASKGVWMMSRRNVGWHTSQVDQVRTTWRRTSLERPPCWRGAARPSGGGGRIVHRSDVWSFYFSAKGNLRIAGWLCDVPRRSRWTLRCFSSQRFSLNPERCANYA